MRHITYPAWDKLAKAERRRDIFRRFMAMLSAMAMLLTMFSWDGVSQALAEGDESQPAVVETAPPTPEPTPAPTPTPTPEPTTPPETDAPDEGGDR